MELAEVLASSGCLAAAAAAELSRDARERVTFPPLRATGEAITLLGLSKT